MTSNIFKAHPMRMCFSYAIERMWCLCPQLFNQDCLEGMKNLPDKSIDMILCDLPYGTTQNKWDTIIPFDSLWVQYNRVIKDNGAIVLFSQMPFTFKLYNSNPKMFRYEWIWQKSQGTGFLNANRMPLKAHENIMVFYKRLPTYNPQKWQGTPYIRTRTNWKSENYGEYKGVTTENLDGLRFPVDIIKSNCERGLHPTQKPVALLEYLIKTYTNEGETVLDNCMGSGSTGVACMNTRRQFIGYELNKEYYEIAKQRIQSAVFVLKGR